MRWAGRFLVGLTVSVVGCDTVPVNTDSGLDATSGDAQESDAGLADAGSSDAGPPESLCEEWCLGLAQCRAAGTTSEGISLACDVPTMQVPACVLECEAALAEGASACLECESERWAIDCDTRPCRRPCDASRSPQYSARLGFEAALECWFGRERPSSSCTLEPGFSSFTPGDRRSVQYSGTATASGVNPLVIHAVTGERYEVSATGLDLPALAEGTTVLVELDADCLWSCSTSLVLRSETGELEFAGWSGTGPPELPELNLGYVPGECVGVRGNALSVITQDLELPDGTRLRPNAEAVFGSFRVRNGISGSHYSVHVTDTPHGWRAGTVERR